jgi:hypothetical protein
MRALGTAFQVLKWDKVVCRLVYARLDVAQNLVPNFLNGRDTWNWDTLFRENPGKLYFMQDHLILHEELSRESRAGPNPALGHFSLSSFLSPPSPAIKAVSLFSSPSLLHIHSDKLSTHLICIYIKVKSNDGQETSCQWQEGQVQQSIDGSRHTTSCARPHTNQTHPRRNESVPSPSPIIPSLLIK